MGKVSVVGIGPGEYEQMTIKADKVLKSADIIAGYNVYVELVKAHYPDKEYVTTPMKQESLRCALALESAAEGKNVALICSGDAGVYGMSGLLYELKALYEDDEEFQRIEIEVISGVTAALSGAALLGAPLIHDFCVISLSDLLTPWDKIEKRLISAAAADFVIVLYNPSSKKRADYLKKACELILKYKDENIVCGVTRNIGRQDEEYQIMSLGALKDYSADMFTTVFIGNSQTREIDGKMVTPRGYQL